MATYIPEELLDEILVRLPTKSIIRFKSVSKAWQSRLSSRSFIDLYNRRRTTDYPQHIVFSPLKQILPAADLINLAPGPSGLINLAPGPSDLINLAPIPSDLILPRATHQWSVFGPLTNGIYLIVDGIKIAFCNPATHDYNFTKPFPFPVSDHPWYNLHYGFARVEMSRNVFDYRVIVIVSEETFWGCSVWSFVYSLNSQQWKEIDSKGLPIVLPHLELCPQRLLNGRWHWITHRESSNDFSVLSFNFSDETFGSMGAPGGYSHHDTVMTVRENGLLVMDNHLVVVSFRNWNCSKYAVHCTGVDVWMMMEYGVDESWRKIYTIGTEICTSFRRLVGIETQNNEGEDCIETLFFEDRFGEIVSGNSLGYDQTLGVQFPDDYVYWNTLGISTYRETLEPLH